MGEDIARRYFDPKEKGSLGGLRRFARHHPDARKNGYLAKVLAQYPAYSLHKPVRKSFPRNRTIVSGLDAQWQIDLTVLESLAEHNDGYKYILFVIDVFSRKSWAIPMKNKSANATVDAFKTLFNLTERRPRRIQADKGSEMRNVKFKRFLNDHGIHFFHSEDPSTKSALVERLQRTIKEKMWRYFTHANTRRYIDVLDDLVSGYNDTYHRSIKTTPNSVNKQNEGRIWNLLYADHLYTVPKKRPRYHFDIGDHVRIAAERSRFQKGYESGWTREVFVVSKRLPRIPPVYQVTDLAGEEIRGTFYKQELVKVDYDEKRHPFLVEKVLKTRKRGGKTEHLVKYLGWPTKFNTWTTDLVKA